MKPGNHRWCNLLQNFIYLGPYLFLTGLSLCCYTGFFLAVVPGFSSQGRLLLSGTGSSVVGFGSCGSRPPEHTLSCWGAGAFAPLGRVGSSWARSQPVFPALAGGFFTTEPSGKTWYSLFNRLQTSRSFYQCLGTRARACAWVPSSKWSNPASRWTELPLYSTHTGVPSSQRNSLSLPLYMVMGV